MNLLLLLCCVLQPPDADSLKIELLNDGFHVYVGDPTIEMDVKISNHFNENFLLYNLKSQPEQAFFEESFYCSKTIAARPSIIVYDEAMNQLQAHTRIPKDINYKPMTNEVLESVFETEKNKFINGLEVIVAKRGAEVSIQASLTDFELKPGVYFIKLIYSSGDNNVNMVSQNRIAEDGKKYNALMFKGCLPSNVVKLVVE